MHAMPEMLAKQVALHARQGCAHRFDLRDDIDAVTVIFDHFRDAAHLAFGSFQRQERFLRCDPVQHIPPSGS